MSINGHPGRAAQHIRPDFTGMLLPNIHLLPRGRMRIAQQNSKSVTSPAMRLARACETYTVAIIEILVHGAVSEQLSSKDHTGQMA